MDASISISHGVLACPRCNQNYLHQRDVIVFDRREDGEFCTKTSIAYRGKPERVMLRNEDSGNPSDRRHAVIVRFECEQCGENGLADLCIVQHKGQTSLYWQFEQSPDEKPGDERRVVPFPK